MKSKKKYIILGIIWVIFTIAGGLAGGFIAQTLLGSTTSAFWTGFGLGCLFGFLGYILILIWLHDYIL